MGDCDLAERGRNELFPRANDRPGDAVHCRDFERRWASRHDQQCRYKRERDQAILLEWAFLTRNFPNGVLY
jgi:hypothetical protein